MDKTPGRHSISNRLTAMVAGILAMAVLVSGSLNLFQQQRQLKHELETKATSLVQFMAQVTPLSILSLNFVEMNNNVEKVVLTDEDAVYAVILNEQGIPLVYFFEETDPLVTSQVRDLVDERDPLAAIESMKQAGQILEVTAPIFSGQKRIGSAMLGFSFEEMRSALLTHIATVSIILVIIIGLSIALLRLVLRQILHPVQVFTAAATQISTGDLNVVLTGTDRNDELGILAMAFKTMTAQLRELILGLEQHLAELKRTSQALRESEERFRTAFENANVGVCLVTTDGRLLKVNHAMCQMFGYSREELEQMTISSISYPDDQELSPTFIKSAVAGETNQASFDKRYFHKQGHIIWGHVSSSLVRDAQGEPLYFISHVQDVTAQKQAQEERLAHLRFFEYMDQINRAIQKTNDLEQVMSDVLNIVLSIFGCDRAYLMYPCDPEAAVWRVPMERSRPEYPGVFTLGLEMPMDPGVAATLRLLLATDGPVRLGPGNPFPQPADVAERFDIKSSMLMALYPKVGKPWQFGIHQCSYARPWIKEEERLFREIGRRISDALTSLLAYRNVQEGKERYRIVADNTYDWEFWIDPDSHFLYNSPSCQRITGYTAEEFSFDPGLLNRIIHPEDRELFMHHHPPPTRKQHGAENMVSDEIEVRILRADGNERYIGHVCQSVFDAQGRYLGKRGSNRDITDRKRAEKEIHKLNQELEQRVQDRTAQLEAANHELEAFAYSISHDLRAPLRHIDGFIEMLQNRTRISLDDKGQHYMAVIADSARQMGKLIDDLLSFSRLGRNEMTTSQVDLAGLVDEVVREFEPETESRNVEWTISEIPMARGDRSLLKVVMTNLLSNALKFTRPREQPRIEIGAIQRPEETVIFVRDNGVGFDMEYVDKLFGVFHRLHREEDFEGTGIGLANVQRIIHRHGGKAWAEGRVDHGATFYFSLPKSNREAT
ncbi:MAG: PAS domain S-box protein [Chloroflexota bacterium]